MARGDIIKVYLASRFSKQPELKVYAEELRAQGIEVTSRWLEQGDDVAHDLTDYDDSANIGFAMKDKEDIDRADIFVLVSESPLVAAKRGGSHWETGYAYGIGKPVIVFGPKQNVFHYLPDIVVIDNWAATKELLNIILRENFQGGKFVGKKAN